MGIGIGGLNWFDLAVLLLVLLYVWQGWERGLYVVLPECLSWILAWACGLLGAERFAGFMVMNFGLWPQSSWLWAFIILMLFIEQFAYRGLMVVFAVFPRQYSSRGWQLLWGLLPAGVSGVLVMAFLVLLLVRLPVSYPFKADINGSRFGEWVTGTVERAHVLLIRDTVYLHLQ